VKTTFTCFLLTITVSLILTITLYAQKQNIKGCDVSFVNYVEGFGGTFKLNGEVKDPFDIYTNAGINTARLRIWHTPSSSHSSLKETLLLAQRAKSKGMKILLDIHYSDSWADPANQTLPKAWQSLSFASLKDSVAAYTQMVLREFKKVGCFPEFIQIGNEITCGMLWNFGRVCDGYNSPQQWKQLGELLDTAIVVYRAEAPNKDSAEVMIHIDRGGDPAGAKWFFENLKKQNVAFDIIGLSYYPWWHGNLNALQRTLDTLTQLFPQKILIAETAYPFSLNWCDNTGNIVGLQSQLLPGYPATLEGQSQYLQQVTSLVSALPNNRGMGVVYWASDWICATGASSSWENLALFDFNGNVLPALKEWNAQTAIEETELVKTTQVGFYPNPFTETTTLSLPTNFAGNTSLHLYSLTGEKIEEIQSEHTGFSENLATINGSHLSPGVYFVSVYLNNQFYKTYKIVKL